MVGLRQQLSPKFVDGRMESLQTIKKPRKNQEIFGETKKSSRAEPGNDLAVFIGGIRKNVEPSRHFKRQPGCIV